MQECKNAALSRHFQIHRALCLLITSAFLFYLAPHRSLWHTQHGIWYFFYYCSKQSAWHLWPMIFYFIYPFPQTKYEESNIWDFLEHDSWFMIHHSSWVIYNCLFISHILSDVLFPMWPFISHLNLVCDS